MFVPFGVAAITGRRVCEPATGIAIVPLADVASVITRCIAMAVIKKSLPVALAFSGLKSNVVVTPSSQANTASSGIGEIGGGPPSSIDLTGQFDFNGPAPSCVVRSKRIL